MLFTRESEGNSRIQGFAARGLWAGDEARGERRGLPLASPALRKVRLQRPLETVTFLGRLHVAGAGGQHKAQSVPRSPFSRPRACLLAGAGSLPHTQQIALRNKFPSAVISFRSELHFLGWRIKSLLFLQKITVWGVGKNP